MKRFLIYYLLFFLFPLSFYTFILIFYISAELSKIVQIILLILSFSIFFFFFLYPGFLYIAREKIFSIIGKSREIENMSKIFMLSFLAILFIILNTSLYNLKYYILPVYFFEIFFPFYARKR